MDTEVELNQYVRGRRDSVREREWEHRLRQLPEEERFRIIWGVLQHSQFGLHFAKRCLRDKKHFIAILERGLDTADASNIRWWLDCVISPLGVRRVLTVLQRTLATNPLGVYKAVYHVSSVTRDMDEAASQILREIWADARYRQMEEEPYTRAYGKGAGQEAA